MIERSSVELNVSCQGAGVRLSNASETEKQSRNVEFNMNYLDVALPLLIEK